MRYKHTAENYMQLNFMYMLQSPCKNRFCVRKSEK